MDSHDKYWINLVAHIDLPGHDGVVKMVKRALLWGKHIYSFSAGFIVSLLLLYGQVNILFAVLIGGAIGVLGSIVFRFDGWISTNALEKLLAGVLSILGFFGAAIMQIKLGPDWLKVVLHSAGFAVGGGILGFLVAKFLKFSYAAIWVAITFVSLPISWPVLTIMAFLRNRMLRNKYKGWITSEGKQVIVFGKEAIVGSNGFDRPIFVADASMRRNGNAEAEGIPKFTHAELRNPETVKSKMADAIQRYNMDETSSNSNWVAVLMGGTAIGSSLVYGSNEFFPSNSFAEINPASGLPTIAGSGSPDVAGNSWGTTDHQF